MNTFKDNKNNNQMVMARRKKASAFYADTLTSYKQMAGKGMKGRMCFDTSKKANE